MSLKILKKIKQSPFQKSSEKILKDIIKFSSANDSTCGNQYIESISNIFKDLSQNQALNLKLHEASCFMENKKLSLAVEKFESLCFESKGLSLLIQERIFQTYILNYVKFFPSSNEKEISEKIMPIIERFLQLKPKNKSVKYLNDKLGSLNSKSVKKRLAQFFA